MTGNVFIVIYIIAAFVAVALFYTVVYKSSQERNIYFAYYMIHLLLYIVGTILEITAVSVSQAKVGAIIQYSGFPFVPPLLFLFIREYVNKPIKSKVIINSLFIIPIASFLLVCTNDYTGLYYTKFELIANGDINRLYVEGTILYNILFIHLYSVYIATFYTALKMILTGNEIIKKKLVFIVFIVPVSVIMGSLYLIEVTPYKIDFSPIIMAFASMYIYYYIYVRNLNFSVGYSRSIVLENMSDGYILIDEDNNFLDANLAIYEIFPKLKNAGKRTNIFDYIENFELKNLEDIDSQTKEINIINEKGISKDYKITVSFLERKRGIKIKCWLFYDITESKLLMHDLEYIAKYDNLTGVYNRNSFFKLANQTFNKNKEEKTSFAIIMVDIDFFKSINDTYGHICGDKIIWGVGERLSSKLRKTDIIARYGGEEFVIYIENVSREEALCIGEKLRESIADEKFVFDEIQIEVKISVGVATFNMDKYKNLDDILLYADKSLYEAKAQGRNKVIIC